MSCKCKCHKIPPQLLSKLKPLSDRVLIEMESVENRVTAFGFQVLENTEADKEMRIGHVLAVGEGWHKPKTNTLVKSSLKVGDRVIFAYWAPAKITYQGKTYYFAQERYDILAIISD